METTLFLILSAIGMAAGGITALVAEKFPAHQAKLERWGGDVLVGGIALLGFAFPII